MTLDDLIANLEMNDLKLNQNRLVRQSAEPRKTNKLILKNIQKQDIEEDDMALLTRRFLWAIRKSGFLKKGSSSKPQDCREKQHWWMPQVWK